MKRLTARQLEVLLLAAEGCTNGLIASRLSVSEATVNTSLRLSYQALGARDRAHAVALAIHRGDISLGELARIADTAARSTHDAGPTVAECAAHDRRWPLEKHGE